MGVRVKLFPNADEVDEFLESRDDINYIDLKVRNDHKCILVYEEDLDHGEIQVKGFET